MSELRVPVRLDLLGGWSDQECWDGPAAVLNVAIGWGEPDPYPLRLGREGKLTSRVTGIGTGLGISSILLGARYLQRRPRATVPEAALHALGVERASGNGGGWQDVFGALQPGLKLVETWNRQSFVTQARSAHPLLAHLVLFDTGSRRNSGAIGSRVRELIGGDAAFRRLIEQNVNHARAAAAIATAEHGAWLCLEAWRALCGFVPEMAAEVPHPPECWGHKLLGAGGGGFGAYFVKEPDARATVRNWLRARNVWAEVPTVLEGPQWLN